MKPTLSGIIPPIIGFIMAGIMLFIIGIMFMAGFIISLRSISWRFVFR